MIAFILLYRRAIGIVLLVAVLAGGLWYYGHIRYKAGYQAHAAEVLRDAQQADERYQARRPRGDPALRELLTYRTHEPERLVVRVPVEVPSGTTTCSAERLGPEFLREYNALAAGQIPADLVPRAPGR